MSPSLQTGKTGNQTLPSARFGLERKHGKLEADAEDQEARARLQEFKEFVLRGNVMDVAVGAITGGVNLRSFSFR